MCQWNQITRDGLQNKSDQTLASTSYVWSKRLETAWYWDGDAKATAMPTVNPRETMFYG